MWRLLPATLVLFLLPTQFAVADQSTPGKKSAEIAIQFSGIEHEKEKGEAGTDLSGRLWGNYLFIIENFAIGPSLYYARNVDIGKDEEYGTNSWDLGLGVIAKIYFGDINADNLVPYALAAVTTNKGKNSHDDTKSDLVKAGGGLNIFINRFVAFAPELSYEIYWDKTDYDDKRLKDSTGRTATAKLSFGLNIFI